MNEMFIYYVIAVVIGVLVGAVEIFQRFRAEPLAAISNRWGVGYLVFNGVVAALTFRVTIVFADLGPTTPTTDLMQWAATTGFGAAIMLRAKLLNVQLSDGKEVALGPEIVVQSFLAVIDQQLDRQRAKTRFETVRELMDGIDFERSKIRLPIQIFQAMQRVTEEESEKLMAGVNEVDKMNTITLQDKSYLLGYYLLDMVGADFLRDILSKYRSDFVVDAADPADDTSTSPAQ